MTDPEPISHPKTIWPPAPLHSTEPRRSFVSAEGIEVTQSGSRLVVVNKFIRLILSVEICALLFSLSSPWISFWTNPFHRHVLSRLLPYVISVYRLTYGICLFILFVFAGAFCFLDYYLSLGVIKMDYLIRTVRAGHRSRPMNQLEAIRITKGQPDILGRRYLLRIVWSGSSAIRWWQKILIKSEANTSILGAFRVEANAEKIAAAIAEFAGVPVQHRTTTKNSV